MAISSISTPVHPPHAKYERLIARAKQVPPARTVVVHPCDETSLRGATEAAELGLKVEKLQYVASSPSLLMSGNEASALGAVDAGCRFFAGYPITPSSEILHFLAEWLPRLGGSSLQTEDELSALGAVIGGSFAGVKSMTATSGPGLSLMSEMLGLAVIAEVPAVSVNVQRG